MPRWDLRPPKRFVESKRSSYADRHRHQLPTLEELAAKLTDDEKQGLIDALKHPKRMCDERVPLIYKFDSGRLVRNGRIMAEFLVEQRAEARKPKNDADTDPTQT